MLRQIAETIWCQIINKKNVFLCDSEALKVFRIYRCHPVLTRFPFPGFKRRTISRSQTGKNIAKKYSTQISDQNYRGLTSFPNSARICKRLWSLGIDYEESIPSAYVACRTSPPGWESIPPPEFIDSVFGKTSPKRSFSVMQNERIGLVFLETGETGSINSGTGLLKRFPNTGSGSPACRKRNLWALCWAGEPWSTPLPSGSQRNVGFSGSFKAYRHENFNPDDLQSVLIMLQIKDSYCLNLW
jgi:hypothetical protein